MQIVITCQEPIGGTPLNTSDILAKVSASLWPQLAASSIAIAPEVKPGPPITNQAQLAAVARCVDTLTTYDAAQRAAILNAVYDPSNYAPELR